MKGPIDNVKVTDITINGKVKFETSLKEFVTSYNQFDSIRSRINEFHGFKYHEVHYKKCSFEFIDDKFSGFNMTDREFYIHYKGCKIKVGDTEGTLKKLFKYSYSEKYSIEEENAIVKVQFENSDEYLMFKVKDKKIVAIFTWTNW